MKLTSKVDDGWLTDHWADRRDQPRPTPEMTWYLTFPSSPELHAFVRSAAAAINHCAHLVPVDVPWLHSTLVRPGGVDELRGPEALGDLPAAPDEPLVLDEVLIFDEGVAVIGVGPVWQDWLNAAREHLSTENPKPHVWAHVSLGYATGPEPLAGLIDRLTPLTSATTQLPIGRPRLVYAELFRDHHAYRWQTVAAHDL